MTILYKPSGSYLEARRHRNFKLNNSNYFTSKLVQCITSDDFRRAHKHTATNKYTPVFVGTPGSLLKLHYDGMQFKDGAYFQFTGNYKAIAPFAAGVVPLGSTSSSVHEINTGSFPASQLQILDTSGNVDFQISRYVSAAAYERYTSTGAWDLKGKLVNIAWAFPYVEPAPEVNTPNGHIIVYIDGVNQSSKFVLSNTANSLSWPDDDHTDCSYYIGQTAGSNEYVLKYWCHFDRLYPTITDLEDQFYMHQLCKSVSKNPWQIFNKELSMSYAIADAPPPASEGLWRPVSMGFRQPF